MRYYSSTATPKTLTSVGGINSSVTSMTVDNTTGLPASFPYTLVLDPDVASEEVVSVTAAAGTTLTIVRGQDSTSATSHAAGAVIKHMITARDLQEPQNHMNTGTAVHGISGSVVGTSDAQTLTNKTISGASNTLTNIAQSAVTNLATDLAGKAASVHTHAQSDVTNLTTDLAAKAPLASPSFSGTPLAPTAAADTATTQIATTQYVIGQAGSTTPIANGTAAVGASLKYARADHIHPATTVNYSVHLYNGTFTPTTTGSYVDVPFATEIYDIGNFHSTVTNTNRVTPTVAGYYYVTMKAKFTNTGTADSGSFALHKSNSIIAQTDVYQSMPAANKMVSVYTDGIIYCNGTTDYIHAKCLVGNASTIMYDATLVVLYVGA